MSLLDYVSILTEHLPRVPISLIKVIHSYISELKWIPYFIHQFNTDIYYIILSLLADMKIKQPLYTKEEEVYSSTVWKRMYEIEHEFHFKQNNEIKIPEFVQDIVLKVYFCSVMRFTIYDYHICVSNLYL